MWAWGAPYPNPGWGVWGTRVVLLRRRPTPLHHSELAKIVQNALDDSVQLCHHPIQ